MLKFMVEEPPGVASCQVLLESWPRPLPLYPSFTGAQSVDPWVVYGSSQISRKFHASPWGQTRGVYISGVSRQLLILRSIRDPERPLRPVFVHRSLESEIV